MGFFDKLKAGLQKTKNAVFGQLNEVIKNFRKVDEDLLEELEEIMIMSDMVYNRSFVWVVRGGKTMRKNVETSLGNGSQLLVQGIDDGDSVVVKGMSKVGEGDRVQTVNQAIVR